MKRFVFAALLIPSAVFAISTSGPVPSPLPDATPTQRGAVNGDVNQELSGKRFNGRISVEAPDGSVALSSICVPSLASLPVCATLNGNAIQCVADAGWFACQPDGGWGELGGTQGAVTEVTAQGPLSSTGGTMPEIICQTASSGVAGCLSQDDWDFFSDRLASVGATWPLISDGGTISCPLASAADAGCLSGLDFAAFTAKVNTVSGSGPLHSTGGTDPVMSCDVASDSQPGCMSSADHVALTGKLAVVRAGAPLTSDGGEIDCLTSSDSQAGCLSSLDHSTFNGKVSSVGATAPIHSSGGTTPSITCDVASDTQPGCMSAADHVKLSTAGTNVSVLSPLKVDAGVIYVDPLGSLLIGEVDAGGYLVSGHLVAQTASSPLFISSLGIVSCQTATDSLAGCITAADHASITAKLTSVGATAPLLSDGGSLTIDTNGYLPIGTIDAGFVYARVIDAGYVFAVVVFAGEVDAGTVNATYISAGGVDAGAIVAGSVQVGNLLASSVDAGAIGATSVQTPYALVGGLDAGAIGATSVQTPKLVVGSIDAGASFFTSVQTPVALLGSVDAGQVGAGSVQTPVAIIGSLDAGAIGAGSVQTPVELVGYLDAGFAWLQGGAWLGSKPLNMLLNTDPEGTIDYITDDAGTVPGLGRHLVVQAPTDGGFYGDAGTRRILPYADEVTVWTPAYRDAGIPSSVYGKFVQGSFDGGVSVVDLSAYPFTNVMTCACDVEDGGAAGTPSSCQWSRTNSTGIKLTFFGAGALGWSATCLGTGYTYDAGTVDAGSPAFFEFASLDGGSMGTVCACASVSGTKNEALTFSRSSSGTCMKGPVASGIANGDMVTCSTNQPRVMHGGDGTPPLGLLMEPSRTNTLLQSESFNNAAWSTTSSVISVPTITADVAVAPDGTTTADRFQTSSCGSTSGCNSLIFQATGGVSANVAATVFVKGNGTSGTLTLFLDSTSTCLPCSYNSTTWTRCGGNGVGTSGNFAIGTDNTTVSCGDGQAADVFLWGAQAEIAAYATSYIKTTTSSVTRSQDFAVFNSVASANTTVSFAASYVLDTPLTGWGADQDHGVMELGTTGPTYQMLMDDRAATSQFTLYVAGGGGATYTGVGTPGSPTLNRASASFTGGTCTLVGPTATNSASCTPSASTLVEIGTYNAGTTAALGGVISQVCVDPNPTRCQ